MVISGILVSKKTKKNTKMGSDTRLEREREDTPNLQKKLGEMDFGN
jgi:hypothetical protein